MEHIDGLEESPFHEGEQDVQRRLGIRDKLETFGRRVIRSYLPDQHREFYTKLPFLVLGTVDDRGQPWASIVAGEPGFLNTPDDRTLRVAAPPLFGDPLTTTLTVDRDVGVLGIEPATRRRNRLTGRITTVEPDGFAITVVQSFGNCPQYIQTRDIQVLPAVSHADHPRPVLKSDHLDTACIKLIENADTLFIATAFADGRNAPSRGADVSHRGGRPGFVRVEDERTLVFPDFAGNYHFNTVGNIQLNPKAGLLFIDFDRGDVLYLTGKAEIVWEGHEVRAFAGAERLIRLHAAEVIRVERSLPLAFRFGEYSPLLDQTGSWDQAAAIIAADRDRNAYHPYGIVRIERESEVICSYFLRRADGGGLPSYEPGQFLPIRLAVPGSAEPVKRTYTISDAPGGDHFRLSIKREGGNALVSTYIHDHFRVGTRLEAMAPRGSFVLDHSSRRPVALISAGVGITPMIAMANFILKEGRRTRRFRRTYFIHGARNGRVHAFGAHIRAWAAENEAFTAHVRYSHPVAGDRPGITFDSEGHVDVALLKQVLPLDDYDFYLCGPAMFMQSLFDDLTTLGIREQRIHYESFGPATVLTGHDKAASELARASSSSAPVTVSFAASGVEAQWTPEHGTLLELAEAAGLTPEFSCRSGICGTCATKLRCGAVDYVEEPSADHDGDEVLICCSTPRSNSGGDTCGERSAVVLDL